MVAGSAAFFEIKYGKEPGWVATLGSDQDRFSASDGSESFEAQNAVASYMEAWKPGDAWSPPPITIQFEASGRQLVKTDRIFNGVVGPFLSQKAVGAIGDTLEKAGYLLPMDVLNCDEAFYLWWVPVVEGSVDEVKSTFFPNGKAIKKFAFASERIQDCIAFRPHYSTLYNPAAQGRVFVSQAFCTAWERAKLTGMAFKAV